MKNLIKLSLLAFVLLLPLQASAAKKKGNKEVTDREFWCGALYDMAKPILQPMSESRLKADMQLELAPSWSNRDPNVAYLEAFGRLMMGLAPWLALPDDDTAEGKQRKELKDWALKSLVNAVDPKSPDYLGWRGHGQVLVDAAFLANGFLHAYDALWVPLDDTTKQRYIEEFTQLRRINPPYNNWLLFSATVETFLNKAGAISDDYRIVSALRKINEWYVGDGWYSDGTHFSFDYYGSFVIHPMYVQCLELANKRIPGFVPAKMYETGVKRMQRFATLLERMLSPEGTFPVFGRSITYRAAVMQPLGLLALRGELPEELPNGQVRAAMTAVLKRMFSDKRNYNEKGYLILGFNGSQPKISDYYTNNGSLYLTSLGFLPLGLPANHPFWTDAAQSWTSKKAWEGEEFPRDHAVGY
ncbi:DUF2264 domain-containing protein [Phocaeicola sp.]